MFRINFCAENIARRKSAKRKQVKTIQPNEKNSDISNYILFCYNFWTANDFNAMGRRSKN
jgi:hypothetical protein